MDKFEFGIEYQEDLLKFLLTDRDGYKIVDMGKDSYFTSLDHAIIFSGIKNFYKKYKRIPSFALLQEELLGLFKNKDYVEVLRNEDKSLIIQKSKDLYTHIQDGDLVLQKFTKFISYVELKKVLETSDIKDFNNHENLLKSIHKAISIGNKKQETPGTFLIKDIRDRQLRRLDELPIVPTPFRQINDLTNAGGYGKGSIIVVLDRPKRFKSGMALNIAKGYMKMKKNIFYADFENGQDELSIRLEQSLSNKTKMEVLSGEFDKQIQKVVRKYRRLGGDIYIKRFPSFSTTIDLQREFDKVYQDFGIRFDILITDYAALMSSTQGTKEETQRISEVYIDLANFGLKNNLDHIWSPHHIVRGSYKREATQYETTDIAKCIDIERHVQGIFGLNRNEDEINNHIMRMELVVQRDGKQFGRALFHVDMETQTTKEFTIQQRKAYDEQFANISNEDPREVEENDL